MGLHLIKGIRRLLFGTEGEKRPLPSKSQANREGKSKPSENEHGIEDAVREKYHLVKKIGQGATGSVFQVKSLDNERVYALKVIPKTLMERYPAAKQSFSNEVSMMQYLHHRNLLRLQHYHEDHHFLFIATELCSGGDLAHIIAQTPTGLPERYSVSLLLTVLRALQYMHRHGVIHMDVKPGNILLTDDQCVKLSDFGSVHVRTMAEDGTSKRICGTPQFAAPEVMRANGYRPPLTDLWSCGIMLFVMLTRSMPFDERWWHCVKGDVRQRHVYRALRHERLKSLTPHCQELLDGLLTVNPSERITSAAAIRLCEKAIRIIDPAAPDRQKPWWQSLGNTNEQIVFSPNYFL